MKLIGFFLNINEKSQNGNQQIIEFCLMHVFTEQNQSSKFT